MEETTYFAESSIIPYGMTWRAGINDPAAIKNQTQQTVGDPGAAIAQSFTQSISNKPPKIEIPRPQMSKHDQYVRDLMNNMAPIPSFGVEDDRPETQGELKAKYEPQFITEPGADIDKEYYCNQDEEPVMLNLPEIYL